MACIDSRGYEKDPKYKLLLGLSNGGEVISVGERQIQTKTPSSTSQYYDWKYKPIIDINMTLSVDKVFSRNDIVTVEGLVEHMWKSSGESPSTWIRFKRKL